MTYPDFLDLCRVESNKTSPLSTADKETFTHWINRGLKEHWEGGPYWQIWPWLQDSSTETLANYRIARTAVNSGRVLTFWEEDPRSNWATDNYSTEDAVSWTRDGTNILLNASGATVSVVAFYSIACPEFNYVTDAASTDDLIPSEVVDWLLAYVFKRNLGQNFTSADQRQADRAALREDTELRKMIEVADPLWRNAPWLDMKQTYGN